MELAGISSKEESQDFKEFIDELKVKHFEHFIYGFKVIIQGLVSFDKFDINKDGFIDWEEFLGIILEARNKHHLELFKKFDLNQDNQIDELEMKLIVKQLKDKGNNAKAESLEKLFNIMLTNFDDDKDGQINVDEFTKFFKHLEKTTMNV